MWCQTGLLARLPGIRAERSILSTVALRGPLKILKESKLNSRAQKSRPTPPRKLPCACGSGATAGQCCLSTSRAKHNDASRVRMLGVPRAPKTKALPMPAKHIVDRRRLVHVAKVAPVNLVRLAQFVGVRPLYCRCRENGRGPCAFCAAYLVDRIDVKLSGR